MVFKDRKSAGILLGKELKKHKVTNAVVFGIPRGGVIVAKEVSRILGAPLDVIVVRKLGVPHYPEFGFGAIGPKNIEIIDWDMVRDLRIPAEEINRVIKKEKMELERRLKTYRNSKTKNFNNNIIAVLVDDGVATGITVQAAIEYLKLLKPQKIIVASPVCTTDSFEEISEVTDDTMCLHIPDVFYSVGQFYEDFPQTTDEEIRIALKNSSK